jgi:hypothetical protein
MREAGDQMFGTNTVRKLDNQIFVIAVHPAFENPTVTKRGVTNAHTRFELEV